MDGEGWMIEGEGAAEGPVDVAALFAKMSSGGLVGKQVRRQSSDVALTPDALQTLLMTYQATSAPPPMAEYPRHQEQQFQGPNESLGYLIPVNPSAWAVVAGYLGLFSVLLVPAPFAILAGVLGLRDIKQNPNKSGNGRAVFGIAMGVFFTGILIFAGFSALK